MPSSYWNYVIFIEFVFFLGFSSKSILVPTSWQMLYVEFGLTITHVFSGILSSRQGVEMRYNNRWLSKCESCGTVFFFCPEPLFLFFHFFFCAREFVSRISDRIMRRGGEIFIFFSSHMTALRARTSVFGDRQRPVVQADVALTCVIIVFFFNKYRPFNRHTGRTRCCCCCGARATALCRRPVSIVVWVYNNNAHVPAIPTLYACPVLGPDHVGITKTRHFRRSKHSTG